MKRGKKRSVVGFGDIDNRFVANNKFEAMGARQDNAKNRSKKNIAKKNIANFNIIGGGVIVLSGAAMLGAGQFLAGSALIAVGVSGITIGQESKKHAFAS